MYGFVEGDVISDSTQSFNEAAGNAGISRPDAYAGNHQRLTFSVRNSRLGFKVGAPDIGGIRTAGLVEMDFNGNQPPNASESAFVTSPTFRLRHAFLRIETSVVDILIGQTWQLLGYQPYFNPNTVQLQGIPGEVYSRSPQVRLSHLFKSDLISLELAVAASRPPQRDSGTPDGQAGLRILLNGWKGVHTVGAAVTSDDSFAIAVSGVVRRLDLPELSATPERDVRASGWAYSIDLLLPLIPGTLKDRGNSLTVTGSVANGTGYADLLTSLTGGIGFPSVPGGGTYNANVDSGVVTFTADGVLRTIDWRVALAGLQYYLPPSGRVWVSGNISQAYSRNLASFGSSSKIFNRSWWADANLFVDIATTLRFGLEYAYFRQTYLDNVNAVNHRLQFSTWYVF